MLMSKEEAEKMVKPQKKMRKDLKMYLEQKLKLKILN